MNFLWLLLFVVLWAIYDFLKYCKKLKADSLTPSEKMKAIRLERGKQKVKWWKKL